MATEMAMVHNAFFRAFNSIILQAPYVPSSNQPGYNATDVKDLMFFTDQAITTLNHHHLSEEKVLFPALEKAVALPGYLDVACDQHAAFHDELHELWKMAKEMQSTPEKWTWEAMKAHFDALMPALQLHLGEEVDLLLTFDQFEEKGLRSAWDDSVAEAKKAGFAAFVRTLFFGSQCEF